MAEIWPNTWRSGIGILMSFGLIQISSLFYAQSGDLEQISSYLFAMRVIQILTSFSQAPFYSKLPLLARLYAQNEKKELITIAKKGMMRAHWVFVAGFLGVSLFADSLMKMVNSNIIFVNPKLWTVIGIAFFVERYGAMHMQLYSLTNKIVWHIANGITGIIYISFCLIFYKFLGVYTFPVGLLISYLCFYLGMQVRSLMQVSN